MRAGFKSDGVFRRLGNGQARRQRFAAAATELPALVVVEKDLLTEPAAVMSAALSTPAASIDQAQLPAVAAVALSTPAAAVDQTVPVAVVASGAASLAATADPGQTHTMAAMAAQAALVAPSVDQDDDLTRAADLVASAALGAVAAASVDQTVDVAVMSLTGSVAAAIAAVSVNVAVESLTGSTPAVAQVDQAVEVTAAAALASSIEAALLVGGGGPYEQMHTIVRTHVESALATILGLPVAFPNEKEPQVAGQVEARVHILSTRTQRLGGNRTAGFLYRKHGDLVIELRHDLGLGDKALLDFHDAIRPGFDLLRDQGVQYGVCSLRGGTRDGAHWRHDLVVPFYSDDDQVPDAHATPATNPDRGAAHDAVRTRFEREVATALGVAVRYDNDPRPQPSDAEWVHLSVQTGIAQMVGLGATSRRQVRTPGVATAMIFSPLGVGTSSSLALCDSIALRFRDVTESGCHFEVPEVVSVGRSAQKWQTNVQIPFRIEGVT